MATDPLVAGTYDLVLGYAEGGPVAAALQPAPKQDDRPLRELVCEIGLVEPDRAEGSRLVANARLDDLESPAPRRAHPAIAYLHQDRRLLTDRQLGDRSPFRVVAVVERQMLEQVAGSLDPELAEALRGGWPDARDLLHRLAQDARTRQ